MMMQWHIVNSAEYHAGVKIAGDLYFLSDTKEIYRGEEHFTESVSIYHDTLPVSSIRRNKLYVNDVNLEGKIYDGDSWVTVIKPVENTVTPGSENAVSSKAVIAYVTEELAKITASADLLSSVSWDGTEHILSTTAADKKTTNDIVLSGLGVSISYTSETGELQLLDASGAKIGAAINLPQEKFIESGEYDPETKKIILYFDKEKQNKVEIDATALVDVYTGKDTSTASVTVSKQNEISADVKVSAEMGNTVQKKADGIFVPETDLSSVMQKVDGAVDGNIATLNSAGEVVDSGKKISDLGAQATVFKGATIEEAVGESVPKKGDICIVSKVIHGDVSEKSVHYYDGAQWVDFNASYNAENVYFDKDLVTTSAIGNIKLTDGKATISAAGKNLKQVFDAIFVKEKNPSVTQPSVSISAPQNKAYEVGTSVTPSFTATLNPGKYEFGPATGITATEWTVTDTDGHSIKANTGSFDAFVVADESNYTITATASYGDGAVPKTNTGNNYDSGKIVAGSKAKTSGAITGFRCGFYGTLTTKDEAIDSALVRKLVNKTTSAPAKGNKWDLKIPVGAIRVVVAYPATISEVTSIKDVNGMNAEVKTAFTQNSVDVEGANGFKAASYRVYVYDMAAANDKENTYTVEL